MEKRVCIITGGNDGIGKATAKIIAKNPIKLIIACRDMSKAELAVTEIKEYSKNDDIQCLKLDLGSLSSIREFVDSFKELNLKIDYLINNAGVYYSEVNLTQDGFESMFGINHLGPFLLTNLLLPLMNDTCRIVMVSSVAHKNGTFNIEKFPPKLAGFKGYGISKVCNILFANELQRRLDEQGRSIVVNSIHPGTIHTNFLKTLKVIDKVLWPIFSIFLTTLEQGGDAVSNLAIGEKSIYKEKKAQYFDVSKYSKSNSFSLNKKNAELLWIKSAQAVDLDLESTTLNLSNSKDEITNK